MNGVVPHTPGIDRRQGWPSVNGHDAPTTSIGGSDVIDPGELPVVRAMEAYATAYNHRMTAYLAANPRPPMPTTAGSGRPSD